MTIQLLAGMTHRDIPCALTPDRHNRLCREAVVKLWPTTKLSDLVVGVSVKTNLLQKIEHVGMLATNTAA